MISENIRILWNGKELEGIKRFGEYAFTGCSVLSVIEKTTPVNQNEENFVYIRPKREIIKVCPTPPHLPTDDLSKLKILVWCEANEHISKTEEDGTPYPHQLQTGSVRPFCRKCNSDVVVLDPSIELTWVTILKGSADGECLYCGEKIICFAFKCKGLLRSDVQNEVCNATSHTSNVSLLPNAVENTSDQNQSEDTFNSDLYQVLCHGGDKQHRLSTFGLASYLSIAKEEKFVENQFCTEQLGDMAIKCFVPNCKGIIFQPSCKLVGRELFDKFSRIYLNQNLLNDDHVQCIQCEVIFPIPNNSPKRVCTNCNFVFCEEHQMNWSSCPHHPNNAVEQIKEALTRGSIQSCPNCNYSGQKDLNCNRIICTHCNTNWCYYCGKRSAVGHKCKLYLDQYPELIVGNDRSPIQALAQFHRQKTLRILRELRTTIGDFDNIFNAFDRSQLTIDVKMGERQCILPPITIEEIV